MRRLLFLALVVAGVWWFRRRRRSDAAAAVTVGYADGSSVTLEPGAPELDRMVRIAREAVGP